MSFFWLPRASELLAVLFAAGTVAGFLSGRQGWLSGLLCGLPLSFVQILRRVWVEEGGWPVDTWYVAMPAAVIACGISILGGITGAWLSTARWKA